MSGRIPGQIAPRSGYPECLKGRQGKACSGHSGHSGSARTYTEVHAYTRTLSRASLLLTRVHIGNTRNARNKPCVERLPDIPGTRNAASRPGMFAVSPGMPMRGAR
jgi:hypothetical protein